MEVPPAEELLRKINELEASHKQLKEEMTKLALSGATPDLITDRKSHQHHRSHSISPQRSRFSGGRRKGGGGGGLDAPNSVTAWKQRSTSFKNSSPLQRESRSHDSLCVGEEDEGRYGDGGGRLPVNVTDSQYLNILQSMGQSVYIFDLFGRIIYWNRTAENTFGYSAAEALGQDVIEILADSQDHPVANDIVRRVTKGESWTGQFPVKNRRGDRFLVVATNTPFYDDDNALIGIICVSSNSRAFEEVKAVFTKHSELESSYSRPKTIVNAKPGLDPQQPLQVSFASKISNLASKVSNKVKSKMGAGENSSDRDHHQFDHGFGDGALSDIREDANSSGASTPRGDLPLVPFGVFSSRESGDDDGDEKPAIHKIITSKAEAWMSKKGISWLWKGNEQEGSEPRIAPRFGWPWLHNDQEAESENYKNSSPGLNQENQTIEGNRVVNNDATGSWSSLNVNSTSSASSCGSTSSSTINKVDIDNDGLDFEILWEDLIIGEQIGQGSCGTVYHALWNGSDVAVKVFCRQEYSEDVILSFRQEVSLMKKLRHPNILLFMGDVASTHRFCIVTEFLPRGSLFRLLQKGTAKLDWKRRVQMASDIARGMNYLHHCNPPIIHRDLKSSNLLIDKNWNVKVGDFGLSRLKYDTYLSTKNGKGTPQWMAPEVLRNEPSNEKSDIYSFGVVLWELATEKIPWDNLNPMQVIGAVGFMNQRLEIPKDLDPQWASMIESCFRSDPASRPTSQELLEKLREIQRKYMLQFQAARSASGGTGEKVQNEV